MLSIPDLLSAKLYFVAEMSMKNYLSLFLLKIPKLQMAEEKGSRDPSNQVVQNLLNFAQRVKVIM